MLSVLSDPMFEVSQSHLPETYLDFPLVPRERTNLKAHVAELDMAVIGPFQTSAGSFNRFRFPRKCLHDGRGYR